MADNSKSNAIHKCAKCGHLYQAITSGVKRCLCGGMLYAVRKLDDPKPKRVTILAGGWSASRLDLNKLPGTVIAVNDAARYAPRWDVCVSMDRNWLENRMPWIIEQTRPVWLRRCAVKGKLVAELARPHVHAFECDHTSTTLAGEPGTLNGTHSGFCALNLGYQMLCDVPQAELYLVGFDMARGPMGEAHWFRQYPWVNGHATGTGRLAEWALQFDTAAAQFKAAAIRVFLCGSSSQVRSFVSIDPRTLEAACDA